MILCKGCPKIEFKLKFRTLYSLFIIYLTKQITRSFLVESKAPEKIAEAKGEQNHERNKNASIFQLSVIENFSLTLFHFVYYIHYPIQANVEK